MEKENSYIVLYQKSLKTEYRALPHIYSSKRLAHARAELLIVEDAVVKTKIITIEGAWE